MSILGNAPNAICWLDRDLRFVLVSRGAERLWDLSLDDLQGLSLLTILDEDSIEPTRKSMQQIRQKGDVGLIENTIKLRDGRKRSFLWKASWSSDLRGFFCLAQDISECKTLRSLEENFLAMVSHDIRAPLSSLAAGIELLLAGKQGAIEEGVRRELQRVELRAQKLKELSNELIDLGKLEAGKENLEWEAVHAFNICKLASETQRKEAQNKGIRLIGPSRDALVLGDRLKLVKAMSNLLSQSLKLAAEGSQIVLDVQQSGTAVEFSVSIPVLNGNASGPISSSCFESVIGNGLALAIVKAIVEVHRGDVGVREGENDNTIFWFRIPSSPRQEEDEEWLYVRICRPLLRLHEHYNVALLKQGFLEIVCDELQGALRSILDSLLLILKGAVGPTTVEIREEVGAAHRNAQRLIAFVNDFIDFHKLSSGKQALRLEPHFLADIIKEAIATTSEIAAQRGIKLQMLPTDANLVCDGPKVVQLLVNLLTNAIKFTPDHGEIEIFSVREERGLLLSVSDPGPGIPLEHKDLIFDAFEQGPGSSNKDGTGLGLAICKLMAEAHGWTINVQNREQCAYYADRPKQTGAVFSVKITI
jgi:PAS domain S-box-containing protein